MHQKTCDRKGFISFCSLYHVAGHGNMMQPNQDSKWCDKTVFIQSSIVNSFIDSDVYSIDGSDRKIFALQVGVIRVISAMLALNFIPLLVRTSHTISRRMRNFLLAYVTFMVAVRVSTANTITLIMAFITIGLNYGALYHCYGLDLDAFPNGLAAVLCVIYLRAGVRMDLW